MGRAILIVVVLISTIYAGIIINVQKEMYKLPGVIVKTLIEKESENVSDFALRTAISMVDRLGLGSITDIVDRTVYFDGNTAQHHAPRYALGNNCFLDSIKYTFYYSPNRYLARTYVHGELQDTLVNYPAQIAYYYPTYPYPGPDAYYEIAFPQVNNPNPNVVDSTSHHNYGIVYPGPGSQYISTNPHGAGDWKCIAFGKSNGKTENIEAYIKVPYPYHDNWLDFTNEYTLCIFAKIARSVNNNGTLVWMAATTDSASQYLKPSGGIWYEGGNLHFGATTQYNKTFVEVTYPYTLTASHPFNSDPFHMYTVTYNRGVVKGYVDSTLVGTSFPPLLSGFYTQSNRMVRPNIKGIVFGRKDISTAVPTATYHYYTGEMDNMAIFKTALTPAEIAHFFQGNIKSPVTLYLRD